MKRIFKYSAAIFCAVLMTLAVTAPAQATEAYKPGVVKAAVAKGQTVVLHFYDPQCKICRTQAAVLNKLRKKNPKYARSMRFFRIDWPTYKDHAIVKTYKVESQSTIVLANKRQILGRVTVRKSESVIKKLLDKGL
ncbi:MAG: thioredoxin family protein [Pseudomonadota bacterium]